MTLTAQRPGPEYVHLRAKSECTEARGTKLGRAIYHLLFLYETRYSESVPYVGIERALALRIRLQNCFALWAI